MLCVRWTALKLICPSQNASGHRQRKNLIFSLSRILNLIVHAVTTATVARWIRSFLKEAGVDTSVFKTHSVRGAATSAAAKAFVPLQEILDMADWSNPLTFQQFYYRPVFSTGFGHAVLS